MISPASLAATVARLRDRRPLIHNITSAVVANFNANALLALGAAPVMSDSADEAAAIATAADALVVNLGMPSPIRAAAMREAVRAAVAAGKPWALDPVGVGAIAPRTQFAQELSRLHPTAIRGNASEILGLAGEAGGGRGVDTGIDSDAAVVAARRLASSTGAIVAVTGVVDYVTDGAQVLALRNGHPLMTQVTGMGCTATAIVGACLGAGDGAALASVAHALAITGIAGEMAARGARGSGSMLVAFLDALGALDHELLRAQVLSA